MKPLLLAMLAPASASLFHTASPVRAEPLVRLMFAVSDTAAYERAMAVVHDGRLTAMAGEAFVVVGEFTDARQGHALGLALQRRLRLPFELVYDASHPQADLAWLNPGSSVVAALPVVAPPPIPVSPRTSPGSSPNLALWPLPPALPELPAQRLRTTSGRGTAVAAEPLHYLYAQPRNAQERQRLARVLKLPAPSDPVDSIRVGVYRETPTGLRQLAHREAEITALGIAVERQRRIPGEQVMIGMAP